MKPILTSALIFGMSWAVRAVDAEKTGGVAAPEATVTSSETAASAAIATSTETKVALTTPAMVDPAPKPSLALVTPLQDLVVFHEKEITSLKGMIDRWDARIGTVVKRREGLAQDVQAKNAKIAELSKQSTRASKQEAERLRKEVGRINKDIAAISKELKAHSKDLVTDLKDIQRESQAAQRIAYQQAIADAQKAQN